MHLEIMKKARLASSSPIFTPESSLSEATDHEDGNGNLKGRRD
jgi:hypothetical protein